jgi:hypothetical protein
VDNPLAVDRKEIRMSEDRERTYNREGEEETKEETKDEVEAHLLDAERTYNRTYNREGEEGEEGEGRERTYN